MFKFYYILLFFCIINVHSTDRVWVTGDNGTIVKRMSSNLIILVLLIAPVAEFQHRKGHVITKHFAGFSLVTLTTGIPAQTVHLLSTRSEAVVVLTQGLHDSTE